MSWNVASTANKLRPNRIPINNEDFAAVQKNEMDGTCNCGYLDHKGIMRFGPYHESKCSSFSDGLALVRPFGNGNTQVLCKQGKPLVLPEDFILTRNAEGKLIGQINGKFSMITATEKQEISVTPIAEPKENPASRTPTTPAPLNIDKTQFDSIENLLETRPGYRRNPASLPAEIYDPRRVEEVFYYLQKKFGFVGLSKKALQTKLGPGEETISKSVPLPRKDSRYALMYSLNPYLRHGRLTLYFSIDGNGHVDGWCVVEHSFAPQNKFDWHTSNE